MTKAMSIDHARRGIRVNCLCPEGKRAIGAGGLERCREL
jgi:NAD(P)-dependent dehydrogenase (short-subunit alcohol dehydrogenase family)